MSDAPSTILSADRACVGCGYNLRGLSTEGSCPECGRSIADSIRGDFLEHSDPDWLDKLRFGCGLKLWNIVLTVSAGILAGALVWARLPSELFIGVQFLGSALGIWAAFAITTQEPRISLQEDPVTWRKVIRACVIAEAVGRLLSNAAATTAPQVVLAIPGTFLQLSGLLAFFGELVYLRRFALRIPNAKLAKSTRIVQWGGVSILVVASIDGVLAIMVGPTVGAATVTASGSGVAVSGTLSGTPWSALFAVGACLFAPAAATFGIWYVVLLIRYRRAFAAAAVAARRTINADTFAAGEAAL